MSSLPVAGEEILRQLRCNTCKCLLSIGPVRLINQAYICGRCPGDGFHVKLLETLAKQFEYPCRYKENGCKLHLKWDEVANHEPVCEFERVKCLVPTCDWMGAKAYILQHYKQLHHTHIITTKDSIQFFTKKFKEMKYLTSADNNLFVIELNDREQDIQYKVSMFLCKLKVNTYTYKIDFSIKDIKISFSHNVTANKSFYVERSALKSIFSDLTNVAIKITICNNGKIAISNESSSTLECPVCLIEMHACIYSLNCGHSVCGCCIGKLSACPLCRMHVGPSKLRNYTLEQYRDSVNNL